MSSISGRTRSVSGASSPSAGPSTTSVQVAVRIRPVTYADQSSIPTRWQRSVINASSNNSLQVDSGSVPPSANGSTASSAASGSAIKKQAFSFDRVLGQTDGQTQVFSVAEPLINRFMEGYNVTILAYGQTSSGKSYTMGTAAGDDVDYEGLVAGQSVDPNMGIIPRAVAQIFSSIKQNQVRSAAVQYSARASFIEIYNEDLIDLLADADADARPHVQIREGKNGQIIWSGLREVKVNNVAEVMNHLLRGSSVRRTNETDMNAQSSRSHAIFSLTMTQKKWVGAGPPPSHAPSAFSGRSTPAAPGRVSSGLPRPSSGMPTFGSRPHTPSQPGRHSSVGLRPASTIGSARSASPMPSGDDASSKASSDGEWVTVTSKFHFVDLAGSERLKRTAAQGDRVKEGISINSGLHALGNVISALGDPSKVKRTTHVPYRDSKLTRLLQDSLGGNAHTLMIACVSPTEYNVSETINTLQYANRARNIKNKAELNEVEVGWDDLDYLQTLVQKLRKELSIIKSSGKVSPELIAGAGATSAVNESRAAQREILEWQDRYATLSQKHSQLTADVTKLRAQLDPRRDEEKDKEDYFKLAEPIIVEYEKSIDALEGQLNLTKAALAFVEDLANEREVAIDEQAAKLQVFEEQIESKDATVAELQVKLAKLQEREKSAESYAKDLEGMLEDMSARGSNDATVVADLRKEISRLKEAQRSAEQYTKDLEAKLAKQASTDSSFQQDGGEEELEVLAPSSRENEQPQTPMRSSSSSQRLRRPESLLIDTTNRQSPSNNRLLRRSSGSFLGYNKSDGTRTPGSSPHARTRSMSQSLSLEQLSALSSSPSQSQQLTRGPRPLSLSGSVPPSPTLRAFEPESPANLERKLASMEKETMRLQEALKERDDEIQALEGTVRELRASKPAPTMMVNGNADQAVPMPSPLRQSTTEEVQGDLLTPDQSMSIDEAGPLTPATEKEFFAIKELLAEAKVTDENGDEPSEESITRLDDLMRSMARKETSHREKIETMNEELSNIRKQNETLQALSRDQLQNMTSEIESLRAQLAETDKETVAASIPASTSTQAIDDLKMEMEAQHMTALSEAVRETEAKSNQELTAAIEAVQADHSIRVEDLEKKHSDAQKQLDSLRDEHRTKLQALDAEHRSELEKVVEELQIVLQEKDEIKVAYEQLEEKHRQMLQKAEIDPHEVDTLRSELAETSDALVTLEAALTEAQEERDQLLIEIEMARQSAGDSGNTDRSMDGGNSLVMKELESHKAALSKTKSEMAKIKGDLHAMMEERNKQDNTIKELQAKVATSETRSIRSNGSGSFGQANSTETEAATAATMASLNGTRSPPLSKRSSDYEPPSIDLRSHRPSLGGAGKPPPPTPPPNMPPPPTPSGNGIRTSVGMRSSISSQLTRPESPSNAGGITRSSSITSMNSDGKLSRLLAEQSAEIASLQKQLAHCEADLQANIDLVATLEAALNDSERNLRKSRVQLAEVTRERERYSAQADEMRAQLNSAQHEVESVRNSVMLDKQNYESKLEEERQAKERARQALEARLEEVSRRKNSKLFCL